MTGRPVFNGLGKGTKGVFKAGNEGDYRMDIISKYNAAQICTDTNMTHMHDGAKWHELGKGVINHFRPWKRRRKTLHVKYTF